MTTLDYSGLKPSRPTPKSELCKCENRSAIKLMGAYIFLNPIHCCDCNLEVLPENVNLNQETINEIVYWSRMYGAFDLLWFDSNVYEEIAFNELTNLKSRINQLGIRANRSVNKFQKCYYYLFQDPNENGFKPISICPKCKKEMIKYERGKFPQLHCKKCNLICFSERK